MPAVWVWVRRAMSDGCARAQDPLPHPVAAPAFVEAVARALNTSLTAARWDASSVLAALTDLAGDHLADRLLTDLPAATRCCSAAPTSRSRLDPGQHYRRRAVNPAGGGHRSAGRRRRTATAGYRFESGATPVHPRHPPRPGVAGPALPSTGWNRNHAGVRLQAGHQLPRLGQAGRARCAPRRQAQDRPGHLVGQVRERGPAGVTSARGRRLGGRCRGRRAGRTGRRWWPVRRSGPATGGWFGRRLRGQPR